jgi:DNA (cytosine-5)-methyltransferase 1
MKKNEAEFIKTKDLMSSFFKKDLVEFIQHPEFDAALSHFLLNPGQCPPFMEQSVYYCLRGFFGDFDKTELKGNSTQDGQTPWQRLLPFGSSALPFPPPAKPKFTFIDLFAGIGGFRIAFQKLGGKCVFSCEWDKYAKQTYQANFGDLPYGDVKQFTDAVNVSDEELNRLIPDHDILAAGFPCQPFSIAGVSKKKSLGRKHGFDDSTQGTLFFDIKRIIDVKKPAAFFLENVKNLLTHDNKRTFSIIEQTLNSLGYVWDKNIVDGANWVPQHRKRVFMVGYNPEKVQGIKKEDIIIPEKPDKNHKYKPLTEIIEDEVDDKYTLGPGTWDTLLRHKKYHKEAGNGFGYGLIKRPISAKMVTRTISARYHKDGAEVLIDQPGKPRPRRLTKEEAMQLMGLDPKIFEMPVSDTQAYRQIGNSVVVPAVKETARKILKILEEKLK